MPPFWVLHIYGRRGQGGQIVKLPPTTYPRWAAAFATGTGPLLPSVAPPTRSRGRVGEALISRREMAAGCRDGRGEISKVTQQGRDVHNMTAA